jgi:glycosyltransferase involved in cell wall biosynthesis
MRIALVTPRYPPTHAGGGEISARLLAEELVTRDIADVTVYSFDGEVEETVGGITVRRLADLPQYPYTLPNEIAYRKLKTADPDCDLFHAYNMHLHAAVGRLSRRLDTPAVATLNAYPLVNWSEVGITPSFQRELYERTLLRLERPRLKQQMRKIDLLLPLSTTVEDVYREHGFSDADFEVVPNMLDTDFDLPTPDTLSNSIQLLYVGHLRDTKGVRYLVDAMSSLPSNFELTIVGGGSEQSNLEARVDESPAAKRIVLTGSVPYESVAQAYADADIFVHPGIWPEPFGRTILEAMQAGLPVVATNVGGPGETVRNKRLLCTPRDTQDLAKSIQYAAKRTEEIGRSNKQYVREQYHPDVVVPQFVDVYERVLESKLDNII